MKRKISSTPSSKIQKKKQKSSCPPSKKVKGTKFAVDAFSYGTIPGVEMYFLTHFHSDHYTGLTKYFKHPIYCSEVTGNLCRQVLNVNSDNIRILELNKTTSILGVQVTAINANHCPGSIMLLFNLPNGQKILHCGDFRADDEMKSHPSFKNLNLNLIYLDTTYCDPKYVFPSKSKSVDMALSILQNKKEEMVKNGDDVSKLLIVCGTYTIGKEFFFQQMASILKLKIWTTPEKNAILKTAIKKNYNKIPSHLCGIHVLPMMDLNHKFLDEHLKSLKGCFTEVIAFKPSGWEYTKQSFVQRDNVTIFGIPYSEHSSFTELQDFIKFCKPNNIIPTVLNRGGNANIQKHFSSWVGAENQNSQKKISDFFKRVTN